MFEKIRDVLAKQFELDPETITRETNLIDIVELIMELEDEFGIKISDEDAVKLDTVGRICDYLDTLK